MSPPLDEAYFTWLYSQVGSVSNRNLKQTYWNLLRILYRKRFEWSTQTVDLARDENRAHDGRDLRREFLDQTGTPNNNSDFLNEDRSYLEMLIALARKLEFDGGHTPDHWFWILISNLGLLECVDATPPDPKIVNEILDKVSDRSYAPNGAGGLFPLQFPANDQRYVEIWYQAQAFLLEHI